MINGRRLYLQATEGNVNESPPKRLPRYSEAKRGLGYTGGSLALITILSLASGCSTGVDYKTQAENEKGRADTLQEENWNLKLNIATQNSTIGNQQSQITNLQSQAVTKDTENSNLKTQIHALEERIFFADGCAPPGCTPPHAGQRWVWEPYDHEWHLEQIIPVPCAPAPSRCPPPAPSAIYSYEPPGYPYAPTGQIWILGPNGIWHEEHLVRSRGGTPASGYRWIGTEPDGTLLWARPY